MWYADDSRITYQAGGGNRFHLSSFDIDWASSPREVIITPAAHIDRYEGYDAWMQLYPRAEEIRLVTETLYSLTHHPRPLHMMISCAESVELLSEYYREQGYYHPHIHHYTPGIDTLVTVSISLRHLLWCEKDKVFLSQKDIAGVPYYALIPPLRTPSDLRSLQQAARLGIIAGMTLLPGDEKFLEQVFEKHILTPFRLSQLLSSAWKCYGFVGVERPISLVFPDFSAEAM